MSTPKAVETTEQQPFADTTKIGLYGGYGKHKTRQIAHLIEEFGADNVLIASAEHGLGTIRSVVKKDNVIVLSSMNDVRANFKAIKAFAKPDRWVCLDGGSQVMEWLANEQFSGADRYFELKCKGLDVSDELKPFGRYMSDKGNIDNMKIYGRIGRDSENFLSSLIGLPCNLYINYLEDMTQSNGYEKIPPWGPDVPGKMGLKAVMSSFDYVMRLGFNPAGKLTAYLNPASNLYLARTREDRTLVKELPTEITDFNLAKFVQLVTGHATSTTITKETIHAN